MAAIDAYEQSQPESRPDAVDEREALDAYSRAVTAVAEALAPSVANLRVTRSTRRGRVPAGEGSGVVLTPDGFILTNSHVVSGAGSGGRASFVGGRELRFSVVGSGPLSGLPRLRADEPGLPPAQLGDAAGLRVGPLVGAVG